MVFSCGGDQFVIFYDGKFEFFGGKIKEYEKCLKVCLCVMVQIIKEIVKYFDKIFIIGYQYFDFDCLGVVVGLSKLCLNLGKEVYIVINFYNFIIKNFFQMLFDDF